MRGCFIRIVQVRYDRRHVECVKLILALGMFQHNLAAQGRLVRNDFTSRELAIDLAFLSCNGPKFHAYLTLTTLDTSQWLPRQCYARSVKPSPMYGAKS